MEFLIKNAFTKTMQILLVALVIFASMCLFYVGRLTMKESSAPTFRERIYVQASSDIETTGTTRDIVGQASTYTATTVSRITTTTEAWATSTTTTMATTLTASVTQDRPTTILVWIPMFEMTYRDERLDENCGQCVVTYDRSKVNNTETKAVVFHFHVDIMEDLPKQRRPDQFYVWWAMESTATVMLRGQTLQEFDGFFNLSMTYRRDSDVWDHYKTKHWKRPKQALTESELDEMIAEKKAPVLWVASNCGYTKGAKKRHQLVNELIAAGLKVRLGGGCSPEGKRENYYFEFYKFYLAFENSWKCRDYITEKFWENALNHGAVPIVVGPSKENYAELAPPNSFIHVDDFATSAKLVEYIDYLDANATAYKQYFMWRTLSPVEMDRDFYRPNGWCKLCRVVKGMTSDDIRNTTVSARKQPKVVDSLREWWYQTEDQRCFQ